MLIDLICLKVKKKMMMIYNFQGDRARFPLEFSPIVLITAATVVAVLKNKNAGQYPDQRFFYVCLFQYGASAVNWQQKKKQEFRTQDIRSASRRGNAFLGRSRQNHLDQVRRWTERKKREFCAGKSGKVIFYALLFLT